jgi:hypothetical protein
MTPLVLDAANLLVEGGGNGGIDPARLKGDLGSRFREAHADVEARRESGEMGFFTLPTARDSMEEVQEVADSFGQWFETRSSWWGLEGPPWAPRAIGTPPGPHWNER